jgi:hypothetical protein
VARFIQKFDPKRERCWIAERAGENVGSVFLVRKSAAVGAAAAAARRAGGARPGIGKRLVAECTRFARQAGYRKIVLWTNDVLDAASSIPGGRLSPGRGETPSQLRPRPGGPGLGAAIVKAAGLP